MKTLQTCMAGEGVEPATVHAAPIEKDRRLWITATTVAAHRQLGEDQIFQC